MSIEKIHEKALHIGSISDLKRELKVDLTQKEEASLEKDFKPFELAESKAVEVQKKIEEQSEEKLKTLKELVSTSKEIKGVAMEKQTGLIGEIEGKVNDTAEQIQKKAQSALSPFEKMRENIENTTKDIAEKITSAWEKIITPIKFGWYSIWAYFGLKYGKEGLAELAKEQVDTVTEDLKKKSEKDEQIGENAGPIALLGTAGLGIFGFIKSQLPKSVADKIDATDKKSILSGLAQNRALKLFGFGGLTLFGLGQLANAAENPEIKAEMGEMPQDKEGQKTWLKKLVEKSADIGSETKEALMSFISEGWDYARGEKLDEYLSKDEKPREGMVTLGEKLSPFNHEADNFLYDAKKLAEQLKYPAIGMAIISPLFRALELGAGINGAKLAWMITKLIGRNVLGAVLLINMGVLAKHKIHVPEDNEKIGEWLREILHLPEIQEELKKNNVPDDMIQSISNNTDEIEDMIKNPENIEKKLADERNKILAAAEKEGIKMIAPAREEVLKDKNREGFERLKKALIFHLGNSENPNEKALIEKVTRIEENIKITGLVEKGDIFEIMKACRGTHVEIHKKYYPYLKWSIKDDANIVKESDILCPDPLEDKETQFHAARKMILRNDNIFGTVGGVFEVGFNGTKDLLGRMYEAMTQNNIQEGANIFEKIYNNKGAMVLREGIGFVLYDVALGSIKIPLDFGKNLLKKTKGEITTQEMIIEDADGLVPLIIFGTVGNKISGKGIIRSIITSPLYTYSKVIGYGHQFCNKLSHADNALAELLDIIADKKMTIGDRFLRMIEAKRDIRYAVGGLFSKNMQIMKKSLREMTIAKQIERKLKIAENLAKPGRHNDKKKIEAILEEINNDITKHLEDNIPHSNHTTHPLSKFKNKQIGDIAGMIPDIEKIASAQAQNHNAVKEMIRSSIQSQAARAGQRLSANPSLRGRLRKYAGIGGILAALTIPVAASIGTNVFNNKESANNDTDDLSESYENTDYQGFDEGIKSEKIDNSAPEMSGVFKAVDDIKDSLIGEDFDVNTSLLSNDVQFFIKTGETEMKKSVDDIYPRYENSINSFRKTVQENREILERYFRENPEKQKKEIKICEFLGLGWKNNKLSLNYMSKEKFENHFYSTFDHVKNNIGDYLDDGHQSGWEKAGEVGKNLTPYVSSWIDTKQAFADIGRGHIKSAILNGSMATLGWASDVLMTLGALSVIVSGPVGPAAGIGGGAALRGINAAIKTSKFGKGIILGEQALEVGTQTAQGMYLAVEKDIAETL